MVWALTWGTGFHVLDSEQIDFGFGSGIVARSALPTEVKSLTKTILDHRGRVDRSSMPNGSTIRDLGVDGCGEVVSRIEAKAVIGDLAVGDKVVHLRAADSSNIPLAKNPGRLVADLAALDSLSRRPILSDLESLGMAWPHERLDAYGPVISVKVTVLGDHKRRVFEQATDIDEVLEWFSDAPRESTLIG